MFSVTDEQQLGIGEASITVVVQSVAAAVVPENTAICLGESVPLVAEGAANATWFAGGNRQPQRHHGRGVAHGNDDVHRAADGRHRVHRHHRRDGVGGAWVPPGEQVYPSRRFVKGLGCTSRRRRATSGCGVHRNS